MNFIFLILFFFSTLFSQNQTGKTFFMPRPAGKELHVDQAAWYLVKRDADTKKRLRFGGTFQVIGFYKQTNDKLGLGTYFGVNGKNSFEYGHGSATKNAIETEDLVHNAIPDQYNFSIGGSNYTYYAPISSILAGFKNSITNPPTPDLTRGFVTDAVQKESLPTGDVLTDVLVAVENYAKNVAPNQALRGTYSLTPRRKEYGVKISYYSSMQDLYVLKIDLPLICVEHELNPLVYNERKYETVDGKKVSMADLVSGSFSNPKKNVDNKDQQDALKFAKIASQKLSENRIGDVDVSLGYLLADQQKYDLTAYARLTAPTSNHPTSEYMFEPLTGNGGHIELAFGLDATMDVSVGAQSSCLELLATFFTGYGFKRKETRTFETFFDKGTKKAWQRYTLVAKKDAAQALQPLANVTTFSVDVYPGFKSEGSFALCYKNDPVYVSVGYSFFARQAEKIKVDKWTANDKYSFVGPVRYRTDFVFDPTKDGLSGIDNSTILTTELDLSSAATPPVFYNTIFANVSYYSNQHTLPLVLNVGFSYDFSQDNVSVEGFGMWLKFGLTF